MHSCRATGLGPACQRLVVAYVRARRFGPLATWSAWLPVGGALALALASNRGELVVRPLALCLLGLGGLSAVFALVAPAFAIALGRVFGSPSFVSRGAARWLDAGDKTSHDAARGALGPHDALDALALLRSTPAETTAAQLAAAHARACAHALDAQLDRIERHPVRPRAALRRAPRQSVWPRVGLFSWGAFALVVALSPARLERALACVTGALIVEWAPEPLSSDWRAHVEPPAYQRRPSYEARSTSGELRAARGSVVHLSATLDVAPRWAELWLFADEEACERHRPLLRVPAAVTPSGALQASLPVTTSVAWSVVVGRNVRHAQQERLCRHITALPDTPPILHVDAPGAEEAWPAKGELTIAWRGEDDFGLARAFVCARTVSNEPQQACRPAPHVLTPKGIRSAPGRQPGAEDDNPGPRHFVQGEVLWPLDSFRPALAKANGEIDVELWVEAFDNDTFTGPNRGQSAVRVVTLYDPRAIRAWSLDAVRQGLQALIVWLADEWAPEDVNVADRPAAHAQLLWSDVEQAWRRLSHAWSLLGEDEQSLPIERHAVDEAIALCQSVREQRERLFEPQETRTRQRRLAATILALDSLFAHRRLGEARAQREDAQSAIERLQQTLRSHHPDAQALSDALSDIKARLASFAEALGNQREHLAQGPATAHSEQEGTFEQALARIEQALERGDKESAARELEALQARLQSMQQSADEQSEQARDPLDEKVQRELQSLATEANRVLENETQLLARLTAALQEPARTQSPPMHRALAQWQAALQAAQRDVQALGEVQRLAPFTQGERESLSRTLQQAQSLADNGLLAEASTALMRAAGTAREFQDRWSPQTIDAMLPGESEEADRAKVSLGRLPDDIARAQAALQSLQQTRRQENEQRQSEQWQALAAPQQEASQAIDRLAASLKALHEQQPMLPASHPALSQAAALAQQTTACLRGQNGETGQRQLADAVASLRSFVDDLAGQQADSQQAGGQAAPLPGTSPGRIPGKGPPGPPDEAPSGAGKNEGDEPGQGPKRHKKKRPGAGSPQGSPTGDKSGNAKGPGRSQNDQAVDIPGFDARRDPSAYRARVQEAAQQPPPPAYKKAVRDYYEELLK